MDRYQWLIVFHIFGAFLLLCGALAFHVLQPYAARRERPSELAALLGIGRVAVGAIQFGSLVVLIFGIWLAYESVPRYKITDEWILVSLVLWVIGNALGAIGGRDYQKAGKLADRLAGEGDAPSTELTALVRSRGALLMTSASTLVILAILVLMVWKPGAP